jgi:hypothetical protein
MKEAGSLERTFGGEFSKESVLEWIDRTLEANKDRKAIGIAVSHSIHNMGISRDYKGIKIAEDVFEYPNDTVRIVFE